MAPLSNYDKFSHFLAGSVSPSHSRTLSWRCRGVQGSSSSFRKPCGDDEMGIPSVLGPKEKQKKSSFLARVSKMYKPSGFNPTQSRSILVVSHRDKTTSRHSSTKRRSGTVDSIPPSEAEAHSQYNEKQQGAVPTSHKHDSLLEAKPERKPDMANIRRHDPWYYSSNHVLVNRSRLLRGLSPLNRNIALDKLAKALATTAAQLGDANGVPIPMCYHANIVCGKSIRDIHHATMTHRIYKNERSTLLNPTFSEFGMATHKAKNGKLYLCQLFLDHSSRLVI